VATALERSPTVTTTTERSDLLQTLDRHRFFLRFTARDLTDDQAAQRTTTSELSIGGVIKHVTTVESGWVHFILEGPSAMTSSSTDWNAEGAEQQWLAGFRMVPGETLPGLLENYTRPSPVAPMRSWPSYRATEPR
jgi:hypothetical protein